MAAARGRRRLVLAVQPRMAAEVGVGVVDAG
jgi:hypothetical protein